MYFYQQHILLIFQEKGTIEKLETSKSSLEQEISRVKRILESTQLQLDEIKEEKKTLANEVTESVARIATLEDELADEKLKREHFSYDLQEQLDKERKLRQISEERLSNLKSRYDQEKSKPRSSNLENVDKDQGHSYSKTEHQLLIEVSIVLCI